MDRVVLLSDVSPEFPNNTSSSFKVRLPHPVKFDGDWEVGLTSVSMPDQGLDLKELLDPDKDSLLSNPYRVDADRIYTQTDTVHRDDLIQKQSAIVDGVGFMKALLHQMEWQRNTTLQNIRGGSVLDHRRVTFRWEEEDAVMERKTLRDINSADIRFSIQKHVALRLGWLTRLKDGTCNLGPNLEYSRYDKDAQKMTHVSATEWPTNRLWSVPSGSDDELVLSQMVEWKFRNLNKAFEQAVTQTSRTLLLYSDVVNSNIVGDASHPLVREVYYRRSGVGTVYFEPLHIQWLLLRRPYLDVIEVSVAESSGPLVAFGKGKTIVTFQFRRRGAHV